MLVSKRIVNLLVASAIAASATASVSSQPTAAVERHGDVCAASGLVRDALKLLQRRVFGAVEREVAMPVQHLLQEAVEWLQAGASEKALEGFNAWEAMARQVAPDLYEKNHYLLKFY